MVVGEANGIGGKLKAGATKGDKEPYDERSSDADGKSRKKRG